MESEIMWSRFEQLVGKIRGNILRPLNATEKETYAIFFSYQVYMNK